MKNELLITLQRLRNTVNEGNSYKRILLENASNSKINTLAMEMERKYGIGVNPSVTTDLVALQSKAIRIYKNSGETFSIPKFLTYRSFCMLRELTLTFLIFCLLSMLI